MHYLVYETTNNTINKATLVKPSDIDSFLEDGWIFGKKLNKTKENNVK